MGGAQLRLPTHTFKPFGEVLIGGAHTNLYRNLFHAVGICQPIAGSSCTGTSTVVTSTGVSNNSFAVAIGGGFDIRLSKHFSLRPFQMDYLSTSFKDTLVPGGSNHQNNWRYLAGINITWGE